MLYRLRPPAELTWCDIPARAGLDLATNRNADLDRLTWLPTESRVFSSDLLRIALRHGVATNAGTVLDAEHTLDLGRSDELYLAQQAVDEAQVRLRASNGHLMERLLPGGRLPARNLTAEFVRARRGSRSKPTKTWQRS